VQKAQRVSELPSVDVATGQPILSEGDTNTQLVAEETLESCGVDEDDAAIAGVPPVTDRTPRPKRRVKQPQRYITEC